ncbi:YeeE/YedE family protein [Noviherbaspirillum cavernae]|uniref:YeeE/YedE family protein n=1 Tax=Noviherbaspirillum cavernae TaxID=2320862 RepID=A0A418WXS8_9BURK|nr:YeeE/YedE family protein [Noviherbaspirillum cavernae]RJG05030.1 YeeE/YedE family protein [Noviherbaspirillum cavernae]
MRFLTRLALVAGGLAIVFAVTLVGGLRQGLLALLGIGFGAVLQGARFGFTTGWRNYIENRDPQGLWAQMLLLVLAAALTLPLIAGNPGELVGAVAPLTFSLVLGAFLFGAAMQLADGCGSGTLYKAGAGAPISFAVLPTFAIGSFLGASHQPAWVALGGLPPVDMLQFGWPVALAITVAGCGLVAWLAARGARKHRAMNAGTEQPAATGWAKRWWIGAILLAILYVLHLIVAGQPWGIVYGIGLWGAKAAAATGWSPVGDAFWGAAPHAQRLVDPILADITSVTNIGLIFGALAASRWNGPADIRIPPARRLLAAAVAGLVMGYSSRMAFGCNVGAFLDGIASASVHGWVWFALAFAGSLLGVRVRQRVSA